MLSSIEQGRMMQDREQRNTNYEYNNASFVGPQYPRFPAPRHPSPRFPHQYSPFPHQYPPSRFPSPRFPLHRPQYPPENQNAPVNDTQRLLSF